jgi:hypothetical protein
LAYKETPGSEHRNFIARTLVDAGRRRTVQSARSSALDFVEYTSEAQCTN